jgi:hypothetical protein
MEGEVRRPAKRSSWTRFERVTSPFPLRGASVSERSEHAGTNAGCKFAKGPAAERSLMVAPQTWRHTVCMTESDLLPYLPRFSFLASHFSNKKLCQNKPNSAFAHNKEIEKQTQSNPIFWLSPGFIPRGQSPRFAPVMSDLLDMRWSETW